MTLRIVQAGRLHQLVRILDTLLLRNFPDFELDHSPVSLNRKKSNGLKRFRLTYYQGLDILGHAWRIQVQSLKAYKR